MEESNIPANIQPEAPNAYTKSLLDIGGNLPPNVLDYCKKETQQMIDLSPKAFANVFGSLVLVDLVLCEEQGYVIGKLKMNRIPKPKSIIAIAETIQKIGMQVMCIVVPARIAINAGYEVEDFKGNRIPPEKLDKVLIILDGQTRYQAYKKNGDKNPYKGIYAYFPLNWIELSELLKAINLKVFTWSNSDFITGTLANENISNEVKTVLEQIQKLERKGYNYTAACEWMTLVKGIIRKNPLIKAIDSVNPELKFEYAKYANDIYTAANSKFTANNEEALKTKTMPEFIIELWKRADANDLRGSERSNLIVSFINSLNATEVEEIVSPTNYERGCGKKKESFVIAQLEKSFKNFLKNNPYENFKGK